MNAALTAIEYYLPDRVLTNANLAADFPDWPVDKIREMTGIDQRHIAGPDQCSSDLGIAAARKVFDSGACHPQEVDYLIVCTQSPDYFLPTTACVVQKQLNLRNDVGALDINLGCSGYVYGLGLAKGLIDTGQAGAVMLITADTMSKFIHAGDKSVRTLFGDAATASLIRSTADSPETRIGPFVFGTDGAGAKNLIVPAGGMRERSVPQGRVAIDDQGNTRGRDNLYMNGPEILAFTLNTVPKTVRCLLERSQLTMDEIDLVVLHQANQYILEHLRKRLKIPEEKFVIALRHCGNTGSSTIPIAMKDAGAEGKLKAGSRVMLVGFGVGYSWAACLIRWL